MLDAVTFDSLQHGIVAHQGGWDELAFVLLPISLFAVLLAIANRRANQQQAAQAEGQAEPAATADDSDPADGE